MFEEEKDFYKLPPGYESEINEIEQIDYIEELELKPIQDSFFVIVKGLVIMLIIGAITIAAVYKHKNPANYTNPKITKPKYTSEIPIH